MGQATQGRATQSEDDFLAALGRHVRETRALRGMSRKVLAKTSGVSERYIAQLESGRGNISIVLLRRLSNAMGAHLEDLIIGSQSSKHWPIIRELVKRASEDRIARAREILSGRSENSLSTQAPSAPLRIALIGLRGAGKSTLGRLVAECLGCEFVELNKTIEQEAGLSIAEVFAIYGQEGYHRLEQASLRKLIAMPGPMMLTTGGGVVAEPLTFDLVLSSFFTVWLKATPEEHMRRVREQGDLRPMGDDGSAMEELRAILASREPLYSKASRVVDTSGLTVGQAADRLMQVIGRRATAGEDRARVAADA